MVERDALGLTRWQRKQTQRSVDPADVHIVHIAADPTRARITDHGRYCPARVPCLGRPAVGIAVPVIQDGAEQVDEIPATYCPRCRGWAVDRRETLRPDQEGQHP